MTQRARRVKILSRVLTGFDLSRIRIPFSAPIYVHFSHFERLLDLLLTLFYKRFTLILLIA